MQILPETELLNNLSRDYSDILISQESYNIKRKELLDQLDQNINNKKYFKSNLSMEIKNKIKDVLAVFDK